MHLTTLSPKDQLYSQLITSLLKPMEDHTSEARADEDTNRLPVCPRNARL